MLLSYIEIEFVCLYHMITTLSLLVFTLIICVDGIVLYRLAIIYHIACKISSICFDVGENFLHKSKICRTRCWLFKSTRLSCHQIFLWTNVTT